MAWFVQPYFELVKVPLSLYGVLWTGLNFTAGALSMMAYKMELRLRQKKSVLLIALFIPFGYLSLGMVTSLYAIGILFLFYVVRGFATPVLKDYIHRMTASESRATVLSLRNFIIRLNFAAIGPFLGWYTDHFTLSQALFLAGIIFLVLSGFTLILFVSALKMSPQKDAD